MLLCERIHFHVLKQILREGVFTFDKSDIIEVLFLEFVFTRVE